MRASLLSSHGPSPSPRPSPRGEREEWRHASPLPTGERDRVRGRVSAAVAAMLCCMLLALPARADEPQPAKSTIQLPADATTHHSLTLNGKALEYTAVAGSLPLTDDKGAKQADIFYVGFFRDNVGDPSKR